MQLALKEAKKASKKGEVPVGAIIVEPKTQTVIAKAFNKVIKNNNPTYHAEVLAITKAAKVIKNYRLTDLELYVTLEPCPMCAGAAIHSRIKKIYFGAFDIKGGAVANNSKIFNNKFNYNHKPLWQGGLLEAECANLLSNFFKQLRKAK